MANVSSDRSTQGMGLVPALRYRDVSAASAWLQTAFGFVESRTLKDNDGTVRYAQLACGNSMVMLCPVGGTAFDAYMTQPDTASGRETQVCYVFVPDAEQHRARAVAAGAELVLDMDAGDGRGRGYACRDPEGHIWSFGTYDPWRRTVADEPDVEADRASPAPGLPKIAAAITAAAIALVAFTGLFGGFAPRESRASSVLADIENVLEKPTDLVAAEKLLRQTREELVRERTLRMQVERQSAGLKEEAIRDREAREAAEKSVREARASIPHDAKPAAAPVTLTALPETQAQTCNEASSAKPLRTVSLAAESKSEITALKAAVAQAEVELRREKQKRDVRAGTLTEIQSRLEKERHAREEAERRMRNALAKISRLERRGEAVKQPSGGFYLPPDFKDLNRVVFPLSARE